MTKKRKYKSIPVNDDRVAAVIEGVRGRRVAVGIDIAKTKQFAAFMTDDGEVQATIRWNHPVESPAFLELLSGCREQGASVEVAMEPSSTYGDALRIAIFDAGFAVHRVNPKRSHDAAEVFDGVPSLHDAKSASIIAKLHLESLSERWPPRTEHERDLAAALAVLKIHEKQYRENRNRLEALLARHWPELPRELDLGSATLLALLVEFGSAREATRRRAEAAECMRRVGGRFLTPERVKKVLDEATTSFGVDPSEGERAAIQAIAGEAERNRLAANRAKRRVEQLTEHEGAAHEMRQVVGKTTAAVLVAAVGDPLHYHCARAYQKALGLNLKEHSSGEAKKGGLHITKRGSGLARLYLYMAALRMLQREPIITAWYAKKILRKGYHAKMKGVIAVMRKLSLALWHVGRGATFDASKLFDVSRLSLPTESNPVATA